MSNNFIPPVKIAEDEIIVDGNRTTIKEHYAQGDHKYVIVTVVDKEVGGDPQFAAHLIATELAEKREEEIIDDYTMSLIEGGVI